MHHSFATADIGIKLFSCQFNPINIQELDYLKLDLPTLNYIESITLDKFTVEKLQLEEKKVANSSLCRTGRQI